MANRHLARSIVMQTLFEWDMSGKNSDMLFDVLNYNIDEFGPGLDDSKFMKDLVQSITTKQKVLDEIIEKAAPEWPVDKISAVDRNVLRIGLYELLFGDYEDVPPKVAINEAIEIAKKYGGENSGRFINGVLGAVYREMGEPGKDVVVKKKRPATVDINELPIETKAGAVVYARHNDTLYFAMVHDVFGYWTLTKGSVEEGEDPAATAEREAKEEIGLDVSVKEKIGENEYIAHHPEKGRIRKQVQYFLAEAPYGDISLVTESGGLDDAQWFAVDEIANLTMYDDVTELLAQSITKLTQ